MNFEDIAVLDDVSAWKLEFLRSDIQVLITDKTQSKRIKKLQRQVVVVLGRGVTESQLSALSPEIHKFKITGDTPDEIISNIPEHFFDVILGDNVTSDQLAKLPPHIRQLNIYSDTPDELLEKLPKNIVRVFLRRPKNNVCANRENPLSHIECAIVINPARLWSYLPETVSEVLTYSNHQEQVLSQLPQFVHTAGVAPCGGISLVWRHAKVWLYKGKPIYHSGIPKTVTEISSVGIDLKKRFTYRNA